MNNLTSSGPSESNLLKSRAEDAKEGFGVDGLYMHEASPLVDLLAQTSKSNGDNTIDFLKDEKREMTLGRRIALSLIDKKWYNPRAGEQEVAPEAPVETPIDQRGHSERKVLEKPNLEKAWAYFEHVALDRYILEPRTKPPTKNCCLRILHKFQKGKKKLEKAEPGNNTTKTMLYSPIFTPHGQVRVTR
jgi:hypothetical protein